MLQKQSMSGVYAGLWRQWSLPSRYHSLLPGTNSAQFSANMKYYMNRYSNLDTPTVITLNDNTGKTLATLMDNAALKQDISGYDMPRKEFFTFQTSDGTTLNGWMMKPADFSAAANCCRIPPSSS